MRLVWHIIKKDLRRLWLPLVLWGVIVMAQYVAWRLDRVAAEASLSEGMAANAMLFFWVLHLVVAWVLVPQIVQDDSLHDDRAAWRTRPISAGRMLLAKLGGMAVMLWFWPSLLTVPWWIEFHFGVAEILRAIVVNMVAMAAFTSVALLVAVLVENFARFLMWSVVVVVAGALGGLVVAAGLPATSDGAVNAAILMTRASLACGLIWAAVVVVVPLQFLKRSPRLARGIAAVAVVMAMGIVNAWPWSGAQMLAATGLEKFALPTITARMTTGTLVVPGDPAKQRAKVRVMTELTIKGMPAGGDVAIKTVEPRWRIGERQGGGLPAWLEHSPVGLMRAAKELAQGKTAATTGTRTLDWEIGLPGQAALPVRNGEAVLGARNAGALWGAERGPSVPLRAGAWDGRGLHHLHVGWVGGIKRRDWRYDYDRDQGSIAWLETEPLIRPTVMLELLNADGMAGRRFATALLMKGEKAILDQWPEGGRRSHQRYLAHGRIPVGLLSVVELTSTFERGYGTDGEFELEEVAGEGMTLHSVVFQEAAPITVTLADAPLLPDLIIESRLDDALKRARAEEKRVLVRLKHRSTDPKVTDEPDKWYYSSKARELMVSRFICVQLSGDEAERLRKRADETDAPVIIVLKPNGEEQDRLRDLYWGSLETALEANLAGKTYAAVLMERLAASKSEDRRLRYQLHDALRARGELSGAFDAILWMVEHPSAPFEGTDVFDVGWRLERLVAKSGAARPLLLQRRDLAVTNLRRDPRDAGAARLLFTITLGLRRDEAAWREFPRIMPKENPLWWEFMRNWINASVTSREYLETTKAVDLEKFFAEGPAWVRAQLMQKRAMVPNGPPATVRDWQRQLVKTGANCAEALAGSRQPEAALRVALAVRRIDGSSATRFVLADALRKGGAPEQAERLLKETTL